MGPEFKFVSSWCIALSLFVGQMHSMDPQAQDHQEKDFLSSLFPLEISVDHLQAGSSDGPQQSMPMFHFNGPSPAQHGQPVTNMHTSIPQSANAQLNMDLLENMMSMQGIENQSPTTQATYNPQLLLEQQFKLAQLQQLQQLQNQIFQQQVRDLSVTSSSWLLCIANALSI
jgi:hypothetical protein